MIITRHSSFHILRVGLAITFLWIGILIFRDPLSWGSLLNPWVLNWLPMSTQQVMIETAIFDITIGFLLLIDVWTWLAALLATLHLMLVLTVVGINEITVRDLGLMAGSLAILFDSVPVSLINRWSFLKSISAIKNNS